MSKIVGILGGMGPMATVDLFKKIIENTPASKDQEHLRIIIDNNSKIPSRVDALLHGGRSPLPFLIESARLLERAGVDFIIIPCNTAHFWIDELRASVKIPIYSMIENAAQEVSLNYGNLNGKIILLATTPTVKLGIYQRVFNKYNIQLLSPTEKEQEIISAVIEQVKAGRIAENPILKDLDQILYEYEGRGIEACIGGCTEIPLIFPYLGTRLNKIDPTLLLAKMAVREALKD